MNTRGYSISSPGADVIPNFDTSDVSLAFNMEELVGLYTIMMIII